MTSSKEDLKRICTNCEYHLSLSYKLCPFRSISNEYCDEYNGLLKDLEVLDILKPKVELMTIEKNHYLKLLNCDGKMIPLTQDEYNKLKRWLENEKDN